MMEAKLRHTRDSTSEMLALDELQSASRGLPSATSEAAEGPVQESLKKAQIIFLHPGPAPLHDDPRYNMHAHLGSTLGGAGIYGSWAKSRSACAELRTKTEPGCGGFEYRPVPTLNVGLSVLRPLRTVLSLYGEAIRYVRSRKDRIDAVVGYSPYGVGLAAYLVSKRLRVPLIIQVQNDLRAAFKAQPGGAGTLKRLIASRLARFVLGRANGWHLYFEGQTGTIVPRGDQKIFYLTDFTPVSMVPTRAVEQPEFLMVGYPWSVKGVDIAIRAFLSAGSTLKGWKLRVVGHCPDRTPFEALAAGNPDIVFEGATSHIRALELIAGCGVYVLASRTEAYGRVAIEAMAAGRPIVATRVGGIPFYVEHERTGLLVEPESVDQLSAAMIRLAHDSVLRQRLGTAARQKVRADHMESLWARKFTAMVHAVIAPAR